jgi:hypothetical protein
MGKKKLRLEPLRAEKNQLYIFTSSVLRKPTVLFSEEEKGQSKEGKFPFHKPFMSVLKLLTIGSSFLRKGDHPFSSISVQTLTVAYTM